MKIVIDTSYDPSVIPAQAAFYHSNAKFKGYGGAMGGGKTRTLCESALDAALRHPGIEIIVARAEHTATSKTTRKNFYRDTLPPELAKYCRIIKSGGEDFIEFPNGSTIHFAGLDDPIKWHSSEIGLLVLDEAHQIDEDTVITLQTRLRQRCKACVEASNQDCAHYPLQVLCGFNPENPGHWLYRYFIEDGEQTEFGRYTKELRLEPDAPPIGDAEFFLAKATDNPFLSDTYIQQNLAGMKSVQRRRYLEGEWLFLSGECYFDQEILTAYYELIPDPLYRFDFKPRGIGDRAKMHKHAEGRITVYEEPNPEHSYAIGADVATGRGADFSVAFVVDLSGMEIVAEMRGKIDADLYAEQLHFLGRWYNTAWLAVETEGGWGEPVIISLRDGRGGRPAYPKLYRHILSSQVDQDVARRWGFPMNVKTRPLVLNQLEKAIRERHLPFLTRRLISECLTFCEFDKGSPSPRAQPKCNDDCVMAAAVALEMYRLYGTHPKREKRIEKRRLGRVRKKLTMYPWQQPAAA